TGDFRAYEVKPEELDTFLFKKSPAEVLTIAGFRHATEKLFRTTILEEWKSTPAEGARQIEQKYSLKPDMLSFRDAGPPLGACSLIIHYLSSSFPVGYFPLPAPIFSGSNDETISLDEETIRNLELLTSYRGLS